jgi:hypothetical protein
MTEHIYPDVFTTSESTKNIVGALLLFNGLIGVVDKDSKNPFFKSDYAPLPSILKAIKDPMKEAGLSINHFPVGDNRLVTRLSHSSGEFYQGVFFMASVKDTPQDRGSVITYMMRYAVGAYLGLSIDKDDDGNKGTGNTAPQAQVLKQMTPAVKDAMLKYITDGSIELVEKQLPKYSAGANFTVITKALADAKNLKELEIPNS